MSKAFTRESDDVPERPLPRLASPLPPGTKNYLTPTGAQRIQDELNQLVETDRPRVAALPESDELRQKLPALDQRILQLRQILKSAVIASPPETHWDQERFGATQVVRNSKGMTESYRIEGEDE